MSSTMLPAIHDASVAIHEELDKIIVGQQDVIDQLLVALLAGQHCLLESAPGSARNLLAESLAQALGLSCYRVHCTPDLRPEELVGRAVQASRQHSGPTSDALTLPHLLLVDDISRLMPATRVVIQQAMVDGGGHLDGQRFVTPSPFIVLAGKYRQDDEAADVAEEPRDDRYMLKIAVRFPDYHDEFQVSDAPLQRPDTIKQVVDPMQLVEYQQAARDIVAPVHVVHYALRLVRSTRVHQGQTPDFAYEWIGIGAGPRASHHLVTAAKMRAAWEGRDFAAIEDVQAMIHCVLRHRLVANQNARANGITPDGIIDRLVYEIPIRIDGDEVPTTAGDDAPRFDVTSDDPWVAE